MSPRGGTIPDTNEEARSTSPPPGFFTHRDSESILTTGAAEVSYAPHMPPGTEARPYVEPQVSPLEGPQPYVRLGVRTWDAVPENFGRAAKGELRLNSDTAAEGTSERRSEGRDGLER